MGQEVINSEVAPEGLPDPEPPGRTTRVEHSYTRELLLSFADLEVCKKRPENLDPVVWRDAPSADVVEGGIAIPAHSSRGLVRRDSREIDSFSKSPVEIPEWRKDSWRSGGSGALVPPGPRRKPYDEEPPGNAFSTSYPPRPAGNWGDNGHQRNNFERPLQGQGSGRWEHRAGFPDREREPGRPLQKWDSEEIVAAPIVPLEALRPDVPRPFGSTGSVVRPGWLPAERDGLLGSGGGLHRTYTGNFTSPSALRAGPERQLSMGPPERQMSLGLPERQMSTGPAERQMGIGPLERQMSMGPPERQNSFGRGISRNSEPYHPSRPLKQGPTFGRREETDFVNDETFGSETSTTDDRAEQERKRREAFELMRKDHQRLLQKQQKLISQKHEERLANPESNASRKHDESALWDSSLSSDVTPSSPPRSPEKGVPDSETAVALVSTPVVAPSTPRPAIPPGFAKVVQQKQTLKASSTQESLSEGDNMEAKEILKQIVSQSESAASSQEKGFGDGIKVAEKLLHQPEDPLDKPEVADSSSPKMLAELVSLATPIEARDDMSQLKSSMSRAGEEKLGWILPTEGIPVDKNGLSSADGNEDNFVIGEEYNTSQESLLDKLFGKSKLEKGSLKDGGLPIPNLVEESQIGIQKDDAWSEGDSKISKFAQWFPQEENQSKGGAGLPSDILSLFPNGGTVKASSNLPSEHALSGQEGPPKSSPVNALWNHGRIMPMPPGPSLEDIEKGLEENASSSHEQAVTKVPSVMGTLSLKNLDVEPRADTMSGVFGEHSPVGKFNFRSLAPQRQSASKSSPVFLTCEDIEQSMLAEAGTTVEKTIPNLSKPSRAGGTSKGKGGQAADSAASRHLLSLLQKGATGGNHSPENSWSYHVEPGEAPGKALADRYHDVDGNDLIGASKKSPSDNATLEALFGKAFMNELRSVEAPLSANANASDYLGNMDGPQASGMYPVHMQSTGRGNNATANTNALQQWPGALGPLASMGWMDNNVREINRHGSLKDVPVPNTKVNQFRAPDKEESRTVTSSGHGLWGNGMDSHVSDGSLPINTGVQNKGSFVSSADSTSFMAGDLTGNSLRGKGHLIRVHNSDLDMRNSSQVNGDGKILPSGNFVSGPSRVSEDSSLPVSPANVLSSDEPANGPIAAFDSSGLPQVFKEDGSAKRLGDISTSKFGVGELSTPREEATAGVSQGIDGFLLAARKTDRKEILEDVLAGDKIGLGDSGNSGNDRKMTDSLSDTLGFIGKAKDGNARLSPVPTAGLPEQANSGLSRTNSNSIRFKNNLSALQPTSQFNGFPVGVPLQHQQSIGSVYRSDSATSLSLQRQQPSISVQHHLQQSPGSGMPMFPPQQFHPQPGLPQQQQLLGRTFSNGGSLEFPHLPFGHAPSTPQNRQLPAGPMHFPPAPHGHLSPPGAYPPMGHMGPTPNHFLPPAQMPQRGPSMSPMGDGHMFMPEQSMHDPHGLGSKPGSQQGPSLFPLGGHALQSGQGPMFHQPLPHNLRGQQNQLLPGLAPWDLRSYSSELMRTSSKGQELSGFVNANGGGANSLDRWFGMELSRNVSGVPSPGLLPVSPHVLDADSKVRFG
ncbi:unnamed protein product [Calypogeia fissa]